MSDSAGKQVPPGMQAIFATGQAMAQGFFDALARQHAAMQDTSGVAAPKLPMPESEVMAAMHKEYAEKLLSMGRAYECYCTPEELDQIRQEAEVTE